LPCICRINMPVFWSFPQLLLILFLTFLFLSLGFSKGRNMTEGLGIIFAAHYLVLNAIGWSYFLHTTSWPGVEVVFRYSFSPFLPGFSFYLGLLTLCLVCGCWRIMISKCYRYSRRQMIFFSLSAVVVVIGVVVSLRIPLEFQSMVDSIETQQNN